MSIVWTERKRIWCGLPLTFTIYSYDEERFYIKTGFLNQREDEVRLYRVQDLTVTRSFIQRIFGMGSMGDFEIRNIKNVAEVKEKLSELVEIQRDKKRVNTREYVSGDAEPDHDDYL